MRYKTITVKPKGVRVGDTIISSYGPFKKVQRIIKRNGGYDFMSNIENLEWHLYDMDSYPDHGTVYIRRDTLKETLKLL